MSGAILRALSAAPSGLVRALQQEEADRLIHRWQDVVGQQRGELLEVGQGRGVVSVLHLRQGLAAEPCGTQQGRLVGLVGQSCYGERHRRGQSAQSQGSLDAARWVTAQSSHRLSISALPWLMRIARLGSMPGWTSRSPPGQRISRSTEVAVPRPISTSSEPRAR